MFNENPQIKPIVKKAQAGKVDEAPVTQTTPVPQVEETDDGISPMKLFLCGDNPFGNFFYPIWKDVQCPCCTFFRGLVTGGIIAALFCVIVFTVI